MRDSDSDMRPPPIPERVEEEEDAKTIPAASAWEIVSETIYQTPEPQKEVSLETLLEGNDSESSSEYEEPIDLHQDRDDENNRQHKKDQLDLHPSSPLGTWSKAKAAVVAIVSILALAVYVKYYHPSHETSPESHEKQKGVRPDTPDPEKQVIVEEPFIVPADLTQGRYQAARELIERTLFSIAGSSISKTSPPGKHQNLEELWAQIESNPQAMADPAFIQYVASKLEKDFAAHGTGTAVPWDGLWKLGIVVYDAASTEIDSVEKFYGEFKDLGVKKDLATYRRWLAEWLLGKRGVYCQVRQRFWEQVKNGSVSNDERKRIGEVRQERERHLTSLRRKNKPLYDLCDRAILKTHSQKN
ncbi:MAG: hypothetical protein GY854_31880 [Deltaproteobacteria bacterium]|nr:hypothetical protein [Deltaproteobacteria bacterium]